MPSNNAGNYGDITVMECMSSSYLPGDNYLWTHQGSVIYSDIGEISTSGKYTSSENPTTFSLIIRNTDLSDFGTYSCSFMFYDSSREILFIECKFLFMKSEKCHKIFLRLLVS